MGNVPTWLIVAIGALLVVNIGALLLSGGQENVDLSGIETKLSTLSSNTAANTAAISELKSQPDTSSGPVSNVSPASPGQYSLTKEEFEDQAVEDEALRLATESVNSRDFKKAALVALENFNVTGVESYRDISFKILDVDADGDEVTFDVKLLYFIDGDEEETESARLLEFVVIVDDLDFDEQFADAEVDEAYLDDLEVLRVYD